MVYDTYEELRVAMEQAGDDQNQLREILDDNWRLLEQYIPDDIQDIIEENELVKCNDCGTWFYEYDGIYVDDHGHICGNCQEDYVYIESQGEYYSVDDCFECAQCGEWEIEDNFHEVYNEDGDLVKVCDSCFKECYYWDSDDEYHTEEEPMPDYITGYHCDERLFQFVSTDEDGDLFHSSTCDDTKLYMGVELECFHADWNNIIDHDDMAYDLKNEFEVDCSEDGSLSEGFEVITNPMTLEAHLKEGTPGMCDMLRCKGYRGHQGYGFHVHINRSYLTDLEQQALVYSVNRNWRYFKNFSLRTEFSWCKPIDDIEFFDCHHGGNNHGTLVNVGNRDTIEFRGFRNTTNRVHFIAVLQLIQSFVDLIKQGQECNLNNVKLMARGNNYQELLLELIVRG